MKKIVLATACILAVLVVHTSFSSAMGIPEVKSLLEKTYPKLKVGEISATEITGLYEVEVGQNIIYFYPEKDLLVFGEIYTKEGQSLTAQKRDRLLSAIAKDIPLDKAIKIGNGKHKVIEFVDPDCPFCRKLDAFMKTRADVTRYVYFLPLPMHQDAAKKTEFILCAPDKFKAYEEVMSGKYDSKKPDTCQDQKVSALLKEHKEIALQAGVNGLPAVWIDGKSVQGANIPAIEKLLATPQATTQ